MTKENPITTNESTKPTSLCEICSSYNPDRKMMGCFISPSESHGDEDMRDLCLREHHYISNLPS